MQPFTRLPGQEKEPYGLEWIILKKIPVIFLTGTMLLACLILFLQLDVVDLNEKSSLQAQFSIVGFMLFHWIAMLGLAILCFIVMLMKGPGYVMDAYPLPDDDT